MGGMDASLRSDRFKVFFKIQQHSGIPVETILVPDGISLKAPPTVVVNRPTENGWRVECVDADGKTVAGCRAFDPCATIGQ